MFKLILSLLLAVNRYTLWLLDSDAVVEESNEKEEKRSEKQFYEHISFRFTCKTFCSCRCTNWISLLLHTNNFPTSRHDLRVNKAESEKNRSEIYVVCSFLAFNCFTKSVKKINRKVEKIVIFFFVFSTNSNHTFPIDDLQREKKAATHEEMYMITCR